MGGSKLAGTGRWTPKNDGDGELSGRHLVHFGRIANDLVNGHHREVEGHELDDGAKAVHGCPYTDSGKAEFSNGRIDDAFGSKLFEHSFRSLVGTVVFGHFFAHQKDAFVAAHFFAHCLGNSLAELNRSHSFIVV